MVKKCCPPKLHLDCFTKHFCVLTSPECPRLDWPRLREMVCRLLVRLPSSEICQWRVDMVNTILQYLENTNSASNETSAASGTIPSSYGLRKKIRTLQRVNRVRDRVRVRVLLAFSCLPIVCCANPQSAFYPWPVIERYDTNCSYVYTLANTTYIGLVN